MFATCKEDIQYITKQCERGSKNSAYRYVFTVFKKTGSSGLYKRDIPEVNNAFHIPPVLCTLHNTPHCITKSTGTLRKLEKCEIQSHAKSVNTIKMTSLSERPTCPTQITGRSPDSNCGVPYGILSYTQQRHTALYRQHCAE